VLDASEVIHSYDELAVAMRKWLPMLILASAQFVMVLDSSVMNVAISQIVEDLNTTIQGVQSAITLYTLVMAAFMLLGAKLGDILGRNRAFAIGLAIYGVGSLTTALSPNLAVLLVGWSGVEGFGAVLVVPAIAALTAASYEGRERALAYALLGGIAAVAIAAGPLIGGWVTTEFSWRYVFAGETVVVIAILLVRGQIARAPGPERRPRLDMVGVALSSSGLGLIVFAILRSSVWGFVQPRTPPTISGTEITPLGFSPVPFMVLGGVALLWAFSAWEQRCARVGRDQLLDTTMLAIAQLRAGLSTLVGQQLVLMGTFFVIPVYLQVVLGLDAFETGKRLLPLSVAMLVFALLGPRIAARRSPRTVAQAGLVAVSIGAIVMLATLDVKLNDTGFKVALALIGAGAGLLASQLGNVIMSSVSPAKTSEGGGLQGTAQNLGSSLGTAIIGAVLLASLATGFSERIADNPNIPAAARQEIAANAEQGIDIVPVETAEQAAVKAGLTQDQAHAVAADYGDAQLDALRLSLGAVALAALLSLWFTRLLPTESLAEGEVRGAEPAAEALSGSAP
jgi:MFS family permease